ncbi:hypothetical protein Tco_0981924 [Tanacetum coccineum]
MRRASKGYSRVVTPLFDTMLVQPQGKTPSTSPSRITSSPSLSSHHTPPSTPNTPPSSKPHKYGQRTATIWHHDSPLVPGGHTPGSDDGRLKHDKLMELVTKLSDRVVAKLEKQVRSGKAMRRARIVLSENEDAVEDPSKQGRKIAQIDTDPTISLVKDEGTSWFQEGSKTSGERNSAILNTAGAKVSTASHDVSTATATLVYIQRSASKAKDKGKAIMQEPEPPKKLKKRVQSNNKKSNHVEAALELQRQLNEREEVPTEATQSQTIDWSDPVVLRYHALQNRPYSVAKVRKNMVMYLKNQAGYKMSYFKGMKYEEIRPIFEKVWDQNQSFVPMDSEDKEKGSKKKPGGSRKKTLTKKRAGEKQSDQSAKRQKTEYDTEKEGLKAYLDIVPGEEFWL